jgi:hypothetical protein
MKRRVFIQTACVAGAVTLIDGPEMFAQNQAAALEKGFQNPPFDAGLSVVHHWTGGVATKEGITADIEGMAASGINTVNWFFFDGTGVSDGIQLYPCKSPQWWELADHLLSEAKRLNMTVAPHVCSSWGPAGTDLITPELSQQQLVWSEVDADGGQPFTPALARPIRPAGRGRGGPTFPPAFSNYYRDLQCSRSRFPPIGARPASLARPQSPPAYPLPTWRKPPTRPITSAWWTPAKPAGSSLPSTSHLLCAP